MTDLEAFLGGMAFFGVALGLFRLYHGAWFLSPSRN